MSVIWPKIILFGDSQVQRSFDPEHGVWGALLANKLQRICDVVSRGFSGYTSRSCLNIIRHVFSSENVSNVSGFVIFVGTNDASEHEVGSPQLISIDEYSHNLKEIIEYLQSIGISKDKVILITPGPYVEEKYLKWIAELGRTFPGRSNETTLDYVNACVKSADSNGIDVINLFQEIQKQEDWEDCLLDGLHLANKGSNVLFENLWPLIEKRVDTSTMLLPYWRDIAELPKGSEEFPLHMKAK